MTIEDSPRHVNPESLGIVGNLHSFIPPTPSLTTLRDLIYWRRYEQGRESMNRLHTALIAGIVLAACHSARAETIEITIDPLDRGNYGMNGGHVPSNNSYAVGVSAVSPSEHRNFFVYDLSSITGTIVDAKLGYLFTTVGPDTAVQGFEDYELYDVTTPFDILLNGDAEVAAFDDLGSGTLFGSTTIFVEQEEIPFEIQLNPAAIESLNQADGLWGIGGKLTTITPGPNVSEGYGTTGVSQDLTTTPLILTIEIPAPGVLALLGAAGLSGRRRRRRRS
jgi:hypothetical protein